MDFKVIWSDETITDLRRICSYIAPDNPSPRQILESLDFPRSKPTRPVYIERVSYRCGPGDYSKSSREGDFADEPLEVFQTAKGDRPAQPLSILSVNPNA